MRQKPQNLKQRVSMRKPPRRRPAPHSILPNYCASVPPKNSEFQFGSPVRTPTGWAEPVTAGGEKFMLGFGLVEGSAGKEYAEWLITINRPSSWRSGNSGSASRSRLCDHVHNLLREEREIREVQWD